jgi:two-component system response regulator FlrC
LRELANALERAAIMADGAVLRGEDFQVSTRAPAGAAGGGTMEDIERDAIRRALEETGGNRRRAAERLGMGERTLYEKLKRYGIG